MSALPRAFPAYGTMSVSGRVVDLHDPCPGDIDIKDVAWHLSYLNRFNGSCEGAVSVAMHSVNVARHLAAQGRPLRVVLMGLLHDAHEGYIGDITTPVLSVLDRVVSEGWMVMGAVKGAMHQVKDLLDTAIFRATGLLALFETDGVLDQAAFRAARADVRAADLAVLVAEHQAFRTPDLGMLNLPGAESLQPAQRLLPSVSPSWDRGDFLAYYDELTAAAAAGRLWAQADPDALFAAALA